MLRTGHLRGYLDINKCPVAIHNLTGVRICRVPLPPEGCSLNRELACGQLRAGRIGSRPFGVKLLW